jgi:hypothetical protein
MHTEGSWECLSYQAPVPPSSLTLPFGAMVQCEGARPGTGTWALRFGTHAYAFQVYDQSPDIVPQARSSAVNSVSILAPHNAEPCMVARQVMGSWRRRASVAETCGPAGM